MSFKPDKSNKPESEQGHPMLGIAYGVKRKNRKKMAKGGEAYKNESAPSEQRPMPDEHDNDSAMLADNSQDKQLHDSKATDRPELLQSLKGGSFKVKHPKMVHQDVYSVRMRDEEDHLEASDSPASPEMRPPMHDNEESADRQGPDADSLHMKKMAEGGMISEEAMMEHEDSIIAAIMSKRAARAALHSGSEDMDSAAHMAEGGMVDLAHNAEESPNEEDQMSFEALKKENYSESEGLDALDQPSDSAMEGDKPEQDEENDHDMVSSIRRKMAMRKQFPIR